MIKIENLNKNFGNQPVFKDFSFSINKGEKIGLVGRNGHGKTTLLKMIIGEIEPDSGEVIIPKNYKIGYLEQHILFSKETILDEAVLGLPDEEKHDTWKAQKILAGLGFSEEDLTKNPNIFSGGYQLRLNLAKVLLSNPDLLLLDEPNNYLDIIAIRWLETFLKSWQNEILLITHDRSFMDKIVSHTVCIHRQKAKKIAGNTSKLYEQIEQEESIYEKTRVNEEKKRKQTEIFISKFRAKARLGGMVQSRIKSLEKSEVKDKLNKIEELDFSFNFAGFNTTQMLEATNLSFSYPDLNNKKNLETKKLIENFEISIANHERIAIIGKNGKGKSTLLKLLAEILTPDTGVIKKHNNLKTGYFGQTNLQTLCEEKTVMDELLFTDPDNSIQKCRNIAGTLMFTGDLALKKIKILSGGEKNRVMLGKILLTPTNLLFLDEPTNHLDMDSCEALLEAINEFEGAVIIVTHNEEYLNNFAERLIIFDEDKITIFNDTYQEFLDKIGWSDERDISVKTKTKIEQKNKNSVDKNTKDQKNTKNTKNTKKQKAEIIQNKAKILKPINDKIAELEKNITNLETEIENINQSLIKASIENLAENIKNFSQKLNQTKKILNQNYEELEIFYLKQEEETAKFQKMLES
jgi:ATP-binding cassette subfamily F protein 3